MLLAWALEGIHLQESFVYYGREITPNDVTLIKVHMSIKSIKAEAFKDRRQLTTVILNDGLEEIGEEAFYKCTSLQGIAVPPTPIIKLVLREGVGIQKLHTAPFGYGEPFALMVNPHGAPLWSQVQVPLEHQSIGWYLPLSTRYLRT